LITELTGYCCTEGIAVFYCKNRETREFTVWAKFIAFAVTRGGISAGYYLGAK